MNTIKIIRFNDDNHAERIWANGQYLGDLSNIESIFDNLINLKILAENEIEAEYTSVWICDDFENYDEDDEKIDTIIDWFYSCDNMNKNQINAIFDKDWELLYDLIKGE